MTQAILETRRSFLTNSIASIAAAGTGVIVGRQLFADPTQIASKIAEAPESHPLLPALKMGSECLKALEEIKDYQAVFVKQELNGRKLTKSTMDLKLRNDPFSVYLKFQAPHKGREVLYLKGKNKNMLRVHDVGFAASLVGTLSIDPNGSMAMDGNRHPVTEIGLHNMTTQIVEHWLTETKMTDMSVNFFPKARIGQKSCQAIEAKHSNPASGAEYHTLRLYVDSETKLPIRVQKYAFPARKQGQAVLIEDYYYSQLKTNVGLSDTDFSEKNRHYNF